jgi:hypothetical protein
MHVLYVLYKDSILSPFFWIELNRQEAMVIAPLAHTATVHSTHVYVHTIYVDNICRYGLLYYTAFRREK